MCQFCCNAGLLVVQRLKSFFSLVVYDFEDDIGSKVILGPLITGGFGDQNFTEKSTEIIYPDGKVTPGPNLPFPRALHCQTSYEQTTYIIGKLFFA